jgi:hypothetical protein
MPTDYIPPDHSLVRYVPWARLRKDESDEVLGVLGSSFKLRQNEDYLSATWMDYFGGTRAERIEKSVHAIRNSRISVRPKSGFAIGVIENICTACERHTKPHRLRVIHEPDGDNKAHTAVRGWPRDEDDLLELIANDFWHEVVLNSSIPQK